MRFFRFGHKIGQLTRPRPKKGRSFPTLRWRFISIILPMVHWNLLVAPNLMLAHILFKIGPTMVMKKTLSLETMRKVIAQWMPGRRGSGGLTRMSQEFRKWLVNGLQPTFKWDILGVLITHWSYLTFDPIHFLSGDIWQFVPSKPQLVAVTTLTLLEVTKNTTAR